MSVKDMVYDHERRITVMSKALHCLKLEVRDLEDWIREKNKIVRCKDCKYCEDESYTDEDTGKEVKYLVCDRWYEQDDADGNMFPKADDFCSKGEKKDD